jgi:hypothetical protein
MRAIFGLAIVLAALTANSAAFAQRTIDPRVIERSAVQVQQPQLAPVAPLPMAVSTVLPANVMWSPVGIDLHVGDQVQISADGQWSAINPQRRATNFSPFTGPNGYPQTAGTKGLLLESANRGALVGRIGEGGTPFLIGASFQGAADSDGPLFVAMNEVAGQFEDNVGRLAVNVSVTPAPPPPPIEEPAPVGESPAAEAANPGSAPVVDRDVGTTPAIPLWLIAVGALGGLAALALLASALFSPRPRAKGGREQSDNRGAATVTARIATDGMRSQMLAISIRGQS